MNRSKVLVIDDEASVAKFLKISLEGHGFNVTEAHSGMIGLSLCQSVRPDIVLLDYSLGDMTGLDVLKNIREWSDVPVIFLTVQNQESDKVQALDNGADDYITKPFGVGELVARINVALRHSHRKLQGDQILVFGQLSIDLVAHLVKWNEVEIKLTQTEFDMLGCLARNYGKVVSHRQLLNEVWGPNAVEHHHYLRVYFGQIRKKLDKAEAGAGACILNESGVGYRLLLI